MEVANTSNMTGWTPVKDFKHKNEVVFLNGKKCIVTEKYQKKVGLLARICLILISFTLFFPLLFKKNRKICFKGKITKLIAVPDNINRVASQLQAPQPQRQPQPQTQQQPQVQTLQPQAQVPVKPPVTQNAPVVVPTPVENTPVIVPASVENTPIIVPAPVENDPVLAGLRTELLNKIRFLKATLESFQAMQGVVDTFAELKLKELRDSPQSLKLNKETMSKEIYKEARKIKTPLPGSYILAWSFAQSRKLRPYIEALNGVKDIEASIKQSCSMEEYRGYLAEIAEYAKLDLHKKIDVAQIPGLDKV